MSKKEKSKKQNETANVEFGMEFGDINASKLYEIPFINEEKTKRKVNKDTKNMSPLLYERGLLL